MPSQLSMPLWLCRHKPRHVNLLCCYKSYMYNTRTPLIPHPPYPAVPSRTPLVHLPTLPFSHSLPMLQIFSALSCGATLLMVPEHVKRSPQLLSKVLFKRNMTTVLQVSMYPHDLVMLRSCYVRVYRLVAIYVLIDPNLFIIISCSSHFLMT